MASERKHGMRQSAGVRLSDEANYLLNVAQGGPWGESPFKTDRNQHRNINRVGFLRPIQDQLCHRPRPRCRSRIPSMDAEREIHLQWDHQPMVIRTSPRVWRVSILPAAAQKRDVRPTPGHQRETSELRMKHNDPRSPDPPLKSQPAPAALCKDYTPPSVEPQICSPAKQH